MLELIAERSENARLLQELDQRRAELERSVRAFVDASAVAIVLVDGEELVLAAAVGNIPRGILGGRLPKDGSMAARVLDSVRPERVSELSAQLYFSLREFGVGASSGLFVPLRFRGANVGVIEALDRTTGPEFRAEDERRLLAAAASAATAVATAQSVERDRLRRTLQASRKSDGARRASYTTRRFKRWGDGDCSCPPPGGGTI